MNNFSIKINIYFYFSSYPQFCNTIFIIMHYTTATPIVTSVMLLCFSRSTEEVIALFISIAFVVDAVKGTVKSKFLTHMADVFVIVHTACLHHCFHSLTLLLLWLLPATLLAFWLCKSRACRPLSLIRTNAHTSIIPAVRSTTSPVFAKCQPPTHI